MRRSQVGLLAAILPLAYSIKPPAMDGMNIIWSETFKDLHRFVPGIWPAFWMMGDAVRNGVEWPLCGELDVFDQVNGQLTATGTVHCQQESGGICNEPSGHGISTSIPDNGWHTWSLERDRTSMDWLTEIITWLRDGITFNRITGSDIGDEHLLIPMPCYVLLNVAGGGTLPGPPMDATQGDYGSMMEVGYLAVYQTARRPNSFNTTDLESATARGNLAPLESLSYYRYGGLLHFSRPMNSISNPF
ncbi:Keratan-sulfate endo-1,4-beta-galactosidase [Colletotrichum orbiculare MAFF 240422]|uniref:Keratan-sulfate endo-1,4-beta-galactosidase n=1 Tax=Colletotrichum orbiculare (strain 104-T / ATCC 96160 / CBS 514.97 / LARS 414 / MAFF 240422) TaxID=1213857 RepID=A0A484FUP0_COLOR|nr:Keratan-sulfate endo-1,4-beta-galactosidase [Colletotrichum orbiculare MAFF 240422]